MTKNTVFGIGTLVATLLGCGGGTKDFGVPSDATAAQMAQTVCAKAYQCCSQAQLMGNQSAGADEASCENMTAQNFKNLLASISASQDKGRSTYDSTKVAACVAHIQASTCGELDVTNHLSGVPGCDSFAIPRVAADGACANDWECIGGWCDKSATDMQAGQDGSCRLFAVAGQSCATDRCGKGDVCAASTTTCVALGGIGAACTTATACASGACAMTPGAPGACASPAGTACFYASACALGPGRPSVMSLLAAVLLVTAAWASRRRRRVA